jgi:hypothetical protein
MGGSEATPVPIQFDQATTLHLEFQISSRKARHRGRSFWPFANFMQNRDFNDLVVPAADLHPRSGPTTVIGVVQSHIANTQNCLGHSNRSTILPHVRYGSKMHKVNGMTLLSSDIAHWLTCVSKAVLGIREIWLIGSRANGTNRADSDWDFLVVAEEKFRSGIRQRVDLHRSDVDFLVSSDGNNFQSAWGREKTVVLSKIQWQLTSDTTATYQGEKWIEDEYDPDEETPYNTTSLGQLRCIQCIGCKVTDFSQN